MEAVVDGLAAAAALPQDLPVFESGDDVFDTGTDAAMLSVVVVADDAPGVVAGRCADRGGGVGGSGFTYEGPVSVIRLELDACE